MPTVIDIVDSSGSVFLDLLDVPIVMLSPLVRQMVFELCLFILIHFERLIRQDNDGTNR